MVFEMALSTHCCKADRISVGINRQAYEAVCTPPEIRWNPQTIVQAQFSIPFTVVAALLDQSVSLRHFTDAGVRRADILALAAKIECAVDPDIERDWSRNISPAEVRVMAGNAKTTAASTIPAAIRWPP